MFNYDRDTALKIFKMLKNYGRDTALNLVLF